MVIRGALMAHRYMNEILRPFAHPFLTGIPNACLQQDNARLHRAWVSQDFLRSYSDSYLTYLDMPPIEHIWNQFNYRCHRVNLYTTWRKLFKMCGSSKSRQHLTLTALRMVLQH
ncbi:hypothetical protein TNIN_227881 [Trichonephila inaurata madagascariensis]|uniref:Tc1-like transposase DDE domain-containing protein n=1 Tax=Trichonephila inaurata madagascariensis TaxID=2747483 RepID=A0A8X6YW05_9ARAC|nr:hypothetical protein TNIN_227881 [Trichonephila inaurata madagascariensis]